MGTKAKPLKSGGPPRLHRYSLALQLRLSGLALLFLCRDSAHSTCDLCQNQQEISRLLRWVSSLPAR